MNLVVRERTEGDESIIVGWIPNEQSLYLFAGSRLSWPLTVSQLTQMREISGLSAWVIIAEQSDLIGHFDLLLDDDTARVGRVIIDPQKRGQGLAQLLIEVIIAKASELGVLHLNLRVEANNLPAIRAYERAGFTSLAASSNKSSCAMTRSL